MDQYNLSSVTFLCLFRIRKNCFNKKTNQLLYFYMRRVIKEFVIIVED